MPPSPASVRIGAWAGVLGPLAYITTWAVLGAVADHYDPTSQAISELGAVGAPTRPWMSLGFVVFGLAALPFAHALRRGLPVAADAVAVLAAVSGVMTVAAAVFPCTPGCPGPAGEPTDVAHVAVAAVGYAALIATPLLVGRQLDRAGRWPRFAAWSWAAGVVSVALIVPWTVGAFGDHGGAAQRAFNTLADLWWVSAGVLLLRQTADRADLRGTAD